jgi:hypothetical protein
MIHCDLRSILMSLHPSSHGRASRLVETGETSRLPRPCSSHMCRRSPSQLALSDWSWMDIHLSFFRVQPGVTKIKDKFTLIPVSLTCTASGCGRFTHNSASNTASPGRAVTTTVTTVSENEINRALSSAKSRVFAELSRICRRPILIATIPQA